MNIKNSLLSGIRRAVQSWKGILIAWLCYVIPVLLLVIPLRGALQSAFGESMITDNLAGRYDFYVFSDLGPVLKNIIASASSGFMVVFLVLFLLNAFVTGGLFEGLKKENMKAPVSDFFSAASINFTAFLIITILVSLAFLLFVVAVALIFAVIINTSGSGSEKVSFLLQASSLPAIFIMLPVFMLVADNSRVIRISDTRMSGFRSLAAGLEFTFKRFWSSYFAILVILIFQFVFGAAAMYLISTWKPVTWQGVFLLFIVSHTLFYLRLLLKTWRYGTVTALMDK